MIIVSFFSFNWKIKQCVCNQNTRTNWNNSPSSPSNNRAGSLPSAPISISAPVTIAPAYSNLIASRPSPPVPYYGSSSGTVVVSPSFRAPTYPTYPHPTPTYPKPVPSSPTNSNRAGSAPTPAIPVNSAQGSGACSAPTVFQTMPAIAPYACHSNSECASPNCCIAGFCYCGIPKTGSGEVCV